MGKKRSRTKYTSKGLRSNVAKATIKLVANEAYGGDKIMNIHKAWLKGLNPWVTVKNDAPGTNRPFIKVRANAEFGDPRRRRNPGESS